MTIVELARPEIRALRPYEAAIQVDDTIRLNANEAPWTARADRFRRPLNRYPEIRPRRLRGALAARYGCKPEDLLVTRGTSEAIDLLMRAFCRAGRDSVVTTAPTFSMYRHYAAVQGASVREVATARGEDFAVDVEALLAACDDSTRLIFVCSPNNPTGNLVPAATIAQLLEQRGDRSAIVVDEAYIEFADAPSVAGLLSRYRNLLVLRTLSKALAFAGARCGAVIGPAEVVSLLDAIQAPYALATPVVECVENALDDEDLAASRHWLREIISERERVAGELAGFRSVRRVWPSAANFLLVEVEDAPRLMRRCADDKVLLRYFGGELADCVRITIGSPDENRRLLDCFTALEAS
jgi:histidinol-phosphate aminotransferase